VPRRRENNELGIQKNFRLNPEMARRLEFLSLRFAATESDVLRKLIDAAFEEIGPREMRALEQMKERQAAGLAILSVADRKS
jgi:predicted DNA-binding protein